MEQMKFDGMLDDTPQGTQEGAPEEEPAYEAPQVSLSLSTFSFDPKLDSTDVIVPRLRLTQGLTKEVQDGLAKPGQWILTGYDAHDSVDIVPLMFSRQRRLLDEKFNVLCHSDDALWGKGKPGGECAVCPMNQWSDGDKGNRVPPECDFSYNYMVYVVEYDTVAIMSLQRTAVPTGKALNTQVAQRGLGHFIVTLKTEQKRGPRGTYAVPTITLAEFRADVIKRASELIGR